MGFSLKWPLWIALVASFVFYRRDLVITNILVRTPLPSGYIANGDYSNCKLLSDHAPPSNASKLNSCEDVVFWDLYNGKSVERALLISCDANRRNWNTVMGPLKDPAPHGQLWLYVPPTSKTAASSALKLERGKSHPVSLVNYPQNHDFHPLGLAIWPSHSGNASNLYIVNHARQRTFIEHFQMDPHNPTEAKHIKTLSSPYFLSPNALALTSPDAFYVTNDHLMTRRLPIVGTVLPIIETVGGIPLSFVLHVQLTLGSSEPHKVTLAAPWIAFANGISLSPSGTQVAVVSSSNNQVYFFHRDPTTNALTYRSKAFVPFCPDNVHFAQPGPGGAGGRGGGGEDPSVLLVAGHPNFKDLQSFAANAPGPGESFAGSWVVELTPRLPSNASSASSAFTDAFDLRAPPDLTKRTIALNKDWTLKTVFQSNGVESEGGFPSSATGLRDPDTGALYVAGLYASGGVLACEAR